MCKEENCKKHPSFNFEGEKKKLYCSKHKLKGMIDIINKRCIFKDCKKQPTFNFEGKKKKLYCSKHKKDNMIDIAHKRCVLCNMISGMKKLDYHCSNCYSFTFPNSDYAKKNRVLKQDLIDDYYKKNYENLYNWDSFDTIIKDTCNKRRPDYFKDFFTHTLMLEIDENQHKNYNKTCNRNRVNELFSGLGDRPMICIRFNPDKYIDRNGNKIKGCFKISEKIGKISLDKKELKERLKSVIREVSYYSNIENIDLKIPYKTIKLFFDEDNLLLK